MVPMRELTVGATVVVQAPASSANLGPGFDSIGLALGVWDRYQAEVVGAPGLVIEVEGPGADEVPRDATHLVYRSMVHAWHRLGVQPPVGLVLRCRNGVPHGRGMGSSAAAIVAGIALAQALSDLSAGQTTDIDRTVTNDLAAELEGHPDNSSAAVYGGLTVSFSDADSRTTTLRAPVHPEIAVVLYVPAEQLSTARARAVLPSQVLLCDAAANSARAAVLVHALGHAPEYLLAGTRDWLHQEPRRPAYPESMKLVDALRAEGHAATISGAGPSVVVLTTRARAAELAGASREGWEILTPLIPGHGVHVVSARLSTA